jgi:hypothetical protein
MHVLALTYRLNNSVKFLQPANPEVDKAANVPNAEVFWTWLDSALANTLRMIEGDTLER